MLHSEQRVAVVRGSIADGPVPSDTLRGVTHLVHLATCKETPEAIIDVAVKGLFWLLEACRASPTFQQFIRDDLKMAEKGGSNAYT